MAEYVVNAPPTRAVPADGYAKGHYGLPRFSGYVIEAPSAKTALKYVEAYRRGEQWAVDMATLGKLSIF